MRRLRDKTGRWELRTMRPTGEKVLAGGTLDSPVTAADRDEERDASIELNFFFSLVIVSSTALLMAPLQVSRHGHPCLSREASTTTFQHSEGVKASLREQWRVFMICKQRHPLITNSAGVAQSAKCASPRSPHFKTEPSGHAGSSCLSPQRRLRTCDFQFSVT